MRAAQIIKGTRVVIDNKECVVDGLSETGINFMYDDGVILNYKFNHKMENINNIKVIECSDTEMQKYVENGARHSEKNLVIKMLQQIFDEEVH